MPATTGIFLLASQWLFGWFSFIENGELVHIKMRSFADLSDVILDLKKK